MRSTVIIQLEVEGFHRYPSAPEEVSFLSNDHRHTFIVRCGYSVSHDNREKEIFIQRNLIGNYLHTEYQTPCKFGAMSCEMIAREILDRWEDDQMIWCEVWEENTGGARVDL